MGNVHFEDFSVQVMNAIDDRINIALEEAAGELESAVKRNTRVDTGQLKNSWQHKLDEREHKAYIGSPLENAIWEEFGTGENALNGNGRQGGWRYKDRKGEWHFTRGKKPKRALYTAFNDKKEKIKKHIQDKFRELG